jgi:tungstate transport system ATP-binding protein
MDEPGMRAPASLLPLTLEHVCFEAGGRRIIDDVSLVIDGGSRTVILGPNGAGKSVLLRLCHGLLAPTAGRIEWNARERTSGPRKQAMVFQRPVMLRRSALANVAYGMKVAGVGATERGARARAALERVGLTHLADRPARVLSGGEQQRLALARAWALNPEVLFLDEPTASLDPGATHEIEAAIAAIHAGGTKIVMVTHNLGQARRLADEVLFMHNGRIAERAHADRFFAGPATPEAAAFLKGELLW